MSDLHLRPRSVTELVDAAFTLYRREPLQYIAVSAILTAPAIALELLIPTPMTTGEITLSAGLAQLIWFVGFSLSGAAVTRAGSDAYLGGEVDAAAALRDVLPRLPAALMATLLSLLAYVIGALFFLVGGAYAVARWFAVFSVVVLEDKGPLEAFERSTDLSEGIKWHVFKTLALTWIIYFVILIGASVIVAPLPNAMMEVAMGMISIVIYPVAALTGMVLYYDARIRNEGFDVEHLARTLDAPAAGAL